MDSSNHQLNSDPESKTSSQNSEPNSDDETILAVDDLNLSTSSTGNGSCHQLNSDPESKTPSQNSEPNSDDDETILAVDDLNLCTTSTDNGSVLEASGQISDVSVGLHSNDLDLSTKGDNTQYTDNPSIKLYHDSGSRFEESNLAINAEQRNVKFECPVVIIPTPKNNYENSDLANMMLYYCFDCLISKLNYLPFPRGLNLPKKQIPLFVKWTKGPTETLRGCIGSFYPFLLREGLQKFAFASATKDSRFSPIQLKEIKHLHVTVSIVQNFEYAMDYLDWEIGLHGIYVRFMNEVGEKVSASFLPEVATLNGWTKLEAIDALLRKCGFEGEITTEFRQKINLMRFETDNVTTSYKEYKKGRRAQIFDSIN